MTHRIGGRAGRVAGPGDVRAGEPDGKQSFLPAAGERVTWKVIHEVVLRGLGLGLSARTGSVVPARRAAARCVRAIWRLPRQPRSRISGNRRVPLI
ncbi:hypothetical protein GCM10009680_57680 [Streptomyces yatensis]|uniref:Uncharacterized protein n=1 Tax=Streptomyces yatensis TaxID=155177 RepID=A0ABN2IPK2_9ACTN